MRCVYFVWSCNSDGWGCIVWFGDYVVVAAGGRFLVSGRVGGVGRSSIVAFRCGGVLLGKRMTV